MKFIGLILFAVILSLITEIVYADSKLPVDTLTIKLHQIKKKKKVVNPLLNISLKAPNRFAKMHQE